MMDKLEFTIHCPVCHMTNINRSLLFNFQGVDHYFCSPPCLKRFKSHPHLFVGDPQHGLSAKQKNQAILKQRKIYLSEQLNDDTKATLTGVLQSLMGIEALVFKGENLYVTYDLLQISLENIENSIEQTAGGLREGVTEKVKRGLIHYSEDCELDNLAHLTKGGDYH